MVVGGLFFDFLCFPSLGPGAGGAGRPQCSLGRQALSRGSHSWTRRLGTSTQSTPDFPEASLSLSWGPRSDGGLGVGGDPPPSPPPRLRAW